MAPPVTTVVAESALVKASRSAIAAPGEEFIEDRVTSRVRGYAARIEGIVLRLTPGFRTGSMRRKQIVPKHNRIRFELKTDVPQPFAVLWKVRNFGEEAERANGLRGQLMPGTTLHEEDTLYHGRHYIEAFVVKGDKLWATAKDSVDIA
jgi:hypothetical protein